MVYGDAQNAVLSGRQQRDVGPDGRRRRYYALFKHGLYVGLLRLRLV